MEIKHPETPEEFILLQKEAIRLTYEWVSKINSKFNLAIPNPQIHFSLKGTTAGRAHYGKHLIQYNPTLLRENLRFLSRTVPHEVIHLAAFRMHGSGIKPHGNEWKSLMRGFGLDAVRCHNYDTANVPSKQNQISNTTGIKMTNFDS